MASLENAIFLSPYGTQIKKEGNVGAGTFQPGALIKRSTLDNVIVHATAEGIPRPLLVADLSVADAGAIDTIYNTTTNTRVNFKAPDRGELVRIRLDESQTIAINDELASAGDGNVKTPAVAGTGVLFIAREAVTTGAAEFKTIIAEVV